TGAAPASGSRSRSAPSASGRLLPCTSSQAGSWLHTSGVDGLTTRAENPYLGSILEDFNADPLTLARGRIERHHVGDVDRCFALHDAARLVGLGIRLGVALDQVDVLHHHPVADHAQHLALLALVLAGDHDDLVALANTVHVFVLRSEHFGRERNDLHELLAAQL